MGVMVSQSTSLSIVYLSVYSGGDQRQHQKFRVTGLCARNSPMTGKFSASNAENVLIWWRHHVEATTSSKKSTIEFNTDMAQYWGVTRANSVTANNHINRQQVVLSKCYYFQSLTQIIVKLGFRTTSRKRMVKKRVFYLQDWKNQNINC